MGKMEKPSSCPRMRRSLTVGIESDRSDDVRLRAEEGLVEKGEKWRDEGRDVETVAVEG